MGFGMHTFKRKGRGGKGLGLRACTHQRPLPSDSLGNGSVTSFTVTPLIA